jgi:serine/threonine protein phosphatase PrpC/membrane protease YdiL (CAAX protease family)
MSVGAGASLQRLTFDNPWIADVGGARRAAPAWLVLLAGVLSAASVGGLARAVGPQVGSALFDRLSGPRAAMLGPALLYGLAFLPLWLTAGLGGLAEGRVVWRAERRPVRAGAAGLLLALGALAATVGLAAAAGAVRLGGVGSTAGVAGVALGLLVFGYQAGAEEVLFRGWMQPVLCARFGPWAGLVTVSAVFGLLHLVGAPHGPLAIVNLMLGGLMFGLLALRSGGLWTAFCAHAGWNWIEACGLGLDPNPGLGPFGALVDLDLAGRPLWSGGADALNGSLALTVLLTAVVGGLLALRSPVGYGPTGRGRHADLAPGGSARRSDAPPPEGAGKIAMAEPGLRIDDAGLSHAGKVRGVNEDSILARPQDGLWAVADGMGGHANGQWASQTVIAALDQTRGVGGYDARVRDTASALHAVNARIWDQGQANGKPMGSTVAALLLQGARYMVFWAGDSRCYLLRDGVIRRLTTDHSQVQALVSAGRLKPEEAENHPMAHVLSRAVGAQAQLQFETVTDEGRAGDVFLLCSDGLTRVVPDPEIAALLSGQPPASAAEQMVALCLERGAPDNVSVVVVRCDEPPPLAVT